MSEFLRTPPDSYPHYALVATGLYFKYPKVCENILHAAREYMQLSSGYLRLLEELLDIGADKGT